MLYKCVEDIKKILTLISIVQYLDSNFQENTRKYMQRKGYKKDNLAFQTEEYINGRCNVYYKKKKKKV